MSFTSYREKEVFRESLVGKPLAKFMAFYP
jgi:hypothetical protein